MAGGRDWQAGDVLRARRNDRRLTVGDGHVRNGDRYQALGPGPQDGLIVQDLTGRGRTVLPAAYLAEHAEYGWASTIDTTQGATADVGIVLVRPGMDREHLYVAMTRGRHGNHAYITPDPNSTDDNHDNGHGHGRPPSGGDDPQEQAVRVLAAALGRSGGQDAAHTALEHARNLATHAARQNALRAEQAAAREVAAAQRQRRQTRPLLPDHARTLRQLQQCQAVREQLRTNRDALHRALRQNRQELEALPRWARGRRRALTDTIGSSEQELRRSEPTLTKSDRRVRPAHPSGRPAHPAAPDQRPGRAAPPAPGRVGSGPCRRAGPALAGAARRPRPDSHRAARRARALPRRRA